MPMLKSNGSDQIVEYPYPYHKFLLDHADDFDEGSLPKLGDMNNIDSSQWNIFPVQQGETPVAPADGSHIYQTTPTYQNGQWVEGYTTNEAESVQYSQLLEDMVAALYPTWVEWERGNATESDVRAKIAEVNTNYS